MTGWQLLEKGAPYQRDHLLPAPSNKYKGFKNKELKYHAAFAIQSQIIALASYRGQRIFRSSTGHFMPSTTAVLNFSKSDHDILSGWSAEGSKRYSRAAKFKTAAMQLLRFSRAPISIPWPRQMMLMPWESSRAAPKRSLSVVLTQMSRETYLQTGPVGDVEPPPGKIFPDDDLDEALSMKKNWQKRSNKPGIVIAQSCWAQTTNKPELPSEQSWHLDATSPLQERSLSRCCTDQDSAS